MFDLYFTMGKAEGLGVGDTVRGQLWGQQLCPVTD